MDSVNYMLALMFKVNDDVLFLGVASELVLIKIKKVINDQCCCGSTGCCYKSWAWSAV